MLHITCTIGFDSFDGQVGKESRGVRTISGMLTLTRIHNSLMSVGGMKHLLLLSKDYAKKRKAFGSLLADQPLHMQTLAR